MFSVNVVFVKISSDITLTFITYYGLPQRALKMIYTSFCFAEILDGESGEEDLKTALDQLRDDQISQY